MIRSQKCVPIFKLVLVLLVALKEISFFECTRLSMLLFIDEQVPSVVKPGK